MENREISTNFRTMESEEVTLPKRSAEKVWAQRHQA